MDLSIRTIDVSNVDRYGFFCYKSKPKTAGYRQKRDWLGTCLPEGVRLKIIYQNDRSVGFIEYAPAEYSWRAIDAPGCMVIHCMWVVGSGKGKGFGSRLLQQVENEAASLRMDGVAVVTSSSTWLAKKDFFFHNGFEVADQAPPAFELLIKRLNHAATAAFPHNWDDRLHRLPQGLVIYHSGQCPYNAMFVTSLLNAAADMDLSAQAVELKTSHEARQLSPSAYGTFGVVYDGQLLSYRPMGGRTLRQMLEVQ